MNVWCDLRSAEGKVYRGNWPTGIIGDWNQQAYDLGMPLEEMGEDNLVEQWIRKWDSKEISRRPKL